MVVKKKSKVKDKLKKLLTKQTKGESGTDTPSKRSRAVKTNPIVARNEAIRRFPRQVGYWSKIQKEFGLTRNQITNVLKDRDA